MQEALRALSAAVPAFHIALPSVTLSPRDSQRIPRQMARLRGGRAVECGIRGPAGVVEPLGSE